MKGGSGSVCGLRLGGFALVLQSSLLDGVSFDPFSFQQDGLAASEVDVGRRQVLQALVVAAVIVVIDEAFDVGFEIAGQVVVLEQDAVLERLMPALDLALGLRMIGRAAHVLHAGVFEPFRQIARDVAGTVVAEQARFVDDAR